MKQNQFRVLLGVSVTLALLIVPLASAQNGGIEYSYGAGVATVTTDSMGAKVTASSQVPHFHWWNATSSTTDFHLIFLKFIEVLDLNENGAFDPSQDRIAGVPYLLPMSNWNFSGFNAIEENSIVKSLEFNFSTNAVFLSTITTTPPTTTNPIGTQEQEFEVTIDIHIQINASNPHELKFGIFLSGWKWIYDDSLLAFQFEVSQSPHEDDQGLIAPNNFSQEGNQFTFGPAYMEYAEMAYSGNRTISVKGTSPDTDSEGAGQTIYLAFEHFGNESLFYDPVIGISGSGSGPGGDNGGIVDGYLIDYEQISLLIGSLSIVVLVILVIKSRS